MHVLLSVDERTYDPRGYGEPGGSAPMGDLYELLDEKTVISTVERAYETGVRIFDTSPHYGNGLAESRMGAGFRRMPRDEIIVSTKIGLPIMRTFSPFRSAGLGTGLAA